ncbi:MAG: phenylalanine--tRNA ligase subunit beta [Gammaproteobacteria bacterium PRO9]|nr:phenylalanine--tRNA ligase subunit beta [Gammaproteobacteria bacterium PRO9]
MKISERWLRELADPPGGTAELVHQLTMQGLEVEGVEPAAAALANVVVGRVMEVTAHPDADRLRICRVDVGTATAQIVCGAANVRAGGQYPVALPGASLPTGITIRKAKLRGVESAGMLCSAAELGIEEADADASAPGLLDLDPGLVPGTPVAEALTLDDQILDLKITPNRADCFSVLGVARDLAATTNVEFRGLDVPAVVPTDETVFAASIDNPADCPVLALRCVRGLRTGMRSPLWLRERLRRSGIRPIHPVVDVTNLVMVETGQPLHAYDLGRLASPLVVRRAHAAEELQLLTGPVVALDEGCLVIADADGAVGIAGIMGGKRTAVSASTTDILLESAHFTPTVIAGRARRLGLQTDAATRFERGVDPSAQVRALERATMLLQAIVGGAAGPCQAIGPGVPPRAAVTLRRDRLELVLGHRVPDDDVSGILDRLQLTNARTDDGWLVTPPAFRFDIEAEIDLIEEVARVHGYDRIPAQTGHQPTRLGKAPGNIADLGEVRSVLVQRGYQEAMTYSFVAGEIDDLLAGGGAGVALQNPLSAELAMLRRSLWPGLLQALRHNLARQQQRIRLFESGIRFKPGATGLGEQSVVAGLIAGSVDPEQWGEQTRRVDFFDLRADVEAVLATVAPAMPCIWKAARHPALHPGQCAELLRDGRHLGWVGALHPTLVQHFDLDHAPLLFELDSVSLLKTRPGRYTGLSRFPTVRRDIAVVVADDTPVGRLSEAAREAGGARLVDVVVFDIFSGKHVEAGQKSVALGLILQETSRTLTDADADEIVGGVVQRLARDFNARIRD